MKSKQPGRLKKIAGRIGGALLAVLLGVVFYVAVVMAEPREEDGLQVQQDQPLLAAAPAVTIAGEDELEALLDSFPVQVLCAPQGAGLALRSGTSYDVAYEGGFARMAEMVYDLGNGLEMKAISIYPARALELLGKGDYHVSASGGASIAGILSVRMENAAQVRMHMQGENALYAVVLPKAEASQLTAYLRPLQLLGGDQQR